MSIAHELHWTTASKPMPGKATEHSGAKKGKGAWDKKKTAKKTSNKGRRAGGKQEIKDQTVGDESDGPFPGSAPLFKKAAAMNWATAEPRPCYPEEEPVEDHCNDSIAPPAPGGGDDMGSLPGAPPVEPRYQEDPDDTLERQWKADDALAPQQQQQQWDHEEDLDLEREAGERQMLDDDEPMDPGDDYMELGDDPMEAPAPEAPQAPQAPQGPGGQQMTGPHDARDPSLAPDAPHQFWSQEQPHVQDALNKYLMPQLNSPNPEIAQKAQRILMEGPHST